MAYASEMVVIFEIIKNRICPIYNKIPYTSEDYTNNGK